MNIYFVMYFIILGVFLATFHNRIGDYSAQFQKKIGFELNESDVELSKKGFLMFGIFLSCIGILELAKLI